MKDIFFVRRPIVAMVIAIIIVAIGILSILQLPIEKYPEIAPPVVNVAATYTGASALDVENSVAVPLESAINGVDNMIYIKSRSGNDGTLSIDTSFIVGTDPDMNTVFTQNKVSTATAKLPSEVTKLGVNTQKEMPNMLLFVALSSDDNRYDQNFLGNYASINVKDVLARIDGVGDVEIYGTSDYSFRIWVDPTKINRFDMSVTDIIDAVNEQNLITPGGKFGAEPAPIGNELTYTVTLPGRLKTTQEFEDIVLRVNPDGSELLLKDLARVELGVETYDERSRMNKSPSTIIAMYQNPGSNGLDTAKQIREAMEELSQRFPPGMKYTISYDSTKAIEEGINEIIETLVIALVLVIMVVFVFLQDWRSTIIPCCAIPVSLIGAFILFPFLGFSVNNISLLGIILAIGIVVDDAIVVIEAIQVNIEQGMAPKEATTAAMKKVTAPVLSTSLVLICVFLPVASIAGITGRLYSQFSITIAASVAFSALNALTLTPALASKILKPSVPNAEQKKFILFRLFNKFFDKGTKTYLSLTTHFTNKFKRSLLLLIIIAGAAVYVGTKIPTGFMPEEDMGYFFVSAQLPPTASLQRTDSIMKSIESELMKDENIEYVSSIVGLDIFSKSISSNSGFIIASLKDWSDRKMMAQILFRLKSKYFIENYPEAEIFAFGPPAIDGVGNSSGFTLMIQDKSGGTVEYLAENVEKFIAAANKRPEIARAFTTFNSKVPQKLIKVDHAKVIKEGVDINDLNTTISTFLGGYYINDFNLYGKQFRTYIQAENKYRQNQNQISNFYVKNANGDQVPISNFVQIENIVGPNYTIRYNLYRAVEVDGSPAPGYTSDQAMAALEEVAAQVLPENMGYEWSNMSYQQVQAGGKSYIAFLMALFFVYLVLSALYESWSLPMAILLGTPFALFGSFISILGFRQLAPIFENNIFMQISLVLLIAMAAKNAILIIEYAHDNFNDGEDLKTAAIDAAKQRFRPILMTAFAFLIGILPLVFASGSGALSRKVMGVSLFGGMLIATILGILFYPAFFLLIGKTFNYQEKRDHENKQT